MPRKKEYCECWDETACKVEVTSFVKDGDFYVLRGRATNLMDKVLPHLRLKLTIEDSSARKIGDTVFHITDRELAPGKTCEFKIEGEWKPDMKNPVVGVFPFKEGGSHG